LLSSSELRVMSVILVAEIERLEATTRSPDSDALLSVSKRLLVRVQSARAAYRPTSRPTTAPEFSGWTEPPQADEPAEDSEQTEPPGVADQ
jgi:hypothetical protein